MANRVAHLINGGALAGLLGWSLYVYGSLPARIPLHFNAAGTPDRFGGATLGNWMLAPLVAVGLVAMMYGIAWLTGIIPHKYVNMPRKRQFLQLPPEERDRIMGVVRSLMYWMSVPLVFLMCVAQASIYVVAMHPGTAMPGYMSVMLVALLVSEALVSIGYIWWLYRVIGEAVREM